MPDETPTVPTTPTTPTVGQSPISGTTPEHLASKGAWEKHRLNKLLQSQEEAMQKIANKAPFRRAQQKTLKKGALAAFNYQAWKHDPYPLVLCSSIYHDGRVAGINLHYLTFKYIKQMVKMYCGKNFSYQAIKGNTFIRNSFRTYKPRGIRSLRMMDCDYLLTILGASRSFNPKELEAIRRFVQEQLRKHLNPTAKELEAMAKEYEGLFLNDPTGWRYDKFKNQIGKLYGKLPQPPNPSTPYGKPTRDDGRFNPREI